MKIKTIWIDKTVWRQILLKDKIKKLERENKRLNEENKLFRWIRKNSLLNKKIKNTENQDK